MSVCKTLGAHCPGHEGLRLGYLSSKRCTRTLVQGSSPLTCRERAGEKRDGALVVGEEEERKEAIVDDTNDKCRGMSGWCIAKEKKLFEKSIEIVIIYAVRLVIYEVLL